MFDEPTSGPIPPTNLPTEPEDMFSDVEKNSAQNAAPDMPDALSSGLLKRKNMAATPPPGLLPATEEGGAMDYRMSRPILGKIIVGLLLALVVGALSYAGWWFFVGRKHAAKTDTTTATVNQSTTDNTAGNNAQPNTNVPSQMNNDNILFGQGVDLDKDGLDDVREQEIGTNPQNPDTDGDGLNDGDEVIVYKSSPLNSDTDADGLSDGDEVLIWKTNILNPDSDGDGYPDGTEVKNGYSPLGPGKLFTAPATTTSVTTSAATTTVNASGTRK